MNIAEIRQKYPQYNDLSDEQLAKGLHQKYYANMSFDDFSQRIGLSKMPQITDEQREVIQARNKAYEDKQASHLTQNPLIRGAVALGQGILNASLNPAGYVARKIGIDTKPLQAENAAERTLEKVGEYGFNAAVFSPVGNYLKAAGLLGKGQRLASKAARAVLAPGKGAIPAAASGGALEGVVDPESTTGKIAANVVGGMLGGAAANISKSTYQTLKGGLENIAGNKNAARIVHRAAKFDDEVAEKVLADMSDAAAGINSRTAAQIERNLGKPNLDTKKGIDEANKIYGNYISDNLNKRTGYVKQPRSFNEFQQDAYEDALKEGLRKAPKGAKEFGLAHINEAKKILNDKIANSYTVKGLEVIPTTDTALLTEVKKTVDKMLQGAGIKPYDDLARQAKDIDYFYRLGKEYKPSNIKYSNINFRKPANAAGNELEFNRYIDRKKAFKSGLSENILYNSTPQQNLSREAKKYQNILSEHLYGDSHKKFLEGITKNEIDYNRLAKIGNSAENHLAVPEGTRFFGREQFESKGAGVGAALDYALGRLNSGYYKKAAQQLLNSKGENVNVLTSPVYQQILRNILTGSVKGAGSNIRIMSLRDVVKKLGDNDESAKK